jgi:hypothetical protein
MDNTACSLDAEFKTWLTDVAKLSGKKLAACLEACEEALIENLDDLRRRNKATGSLKEFLPLAVADMVAEALERSPAEIAKTSKSNHVKDGVPLLRQSSATTDTQAEMPAGKEFFSFLSHKKNNSKLGSITETIALRVKVCMRAFMIIFLMIRMCIGSI